MTADEKKEKPEPVHWWREKKDIQDYDDGFFEPYRKELEPVIPDDYSDPLFEEEWALLNEATPGWPNPGPANLNLNNLFRFYQDKVHQEFNKKKWLVAVLIPTGDGMMTLNCGISLATAYKPAHRFHTVSGHNIGILRNQLVDMALKNKDCTHVFFLDSDTIIPAFTVMRLMRRDLDIVSGLYAMKAPPYVPLAIKRPRHKDTGKKVYNYYINVTNDLLNKIIPVDGAGAGCLLIKREVLEKLGPPWFEVTPMNHGLQAVGEDLFFFDRAIDEGYTPMLDLSIQCDHAAGTVAYPRLFFEGFARPGPKSREMIDVWNKNAILWSLGLPGYKVPGPPGAPEQAEPPPGEKK